MRLVKWALGLGVLLILVVTLASPAAKWGVQHWLERQGYQAEIRRLNINLFTGRVTLVGVNVRHPQGERFTIFEALLEFRWLPLFERRLVLNQVSVKGIVADARFDAQGLHLAGRTLSQWSPLGPDSTWPVAVDYLRLDDLTLCREQRSQCLRMEAFALTQAAWTNDGSSPQFAHRGPLVVERAYVRDQTRNSTLLYLGELRVEQANYLPERATLGRVQVNNFHFLENSLAGEAPLEAPYLSQIGEMTLSDLTVETGAIPRVQVGTVEVTSWRQLLHKEPNRPVTLPWQIRGLLPQDYPGPLGTLWRSEERQWVVNSVELNSGVLSWHDASVVPPAQTRLHRIQLRVGSIDQAMPDKATSMYVAGRFGDRGRLEWEGEIYPFRDSVDLTLSGFVHDLELAPFTGYTEALFNQPVTSGLVDASAKVTVRQGQLQAQSKWRLTDWQVPAVRAAGRTMPLEQALSRLRDHNRAVDFDLPIRGNLQDSNFTFNYVFGTLMRQTLADRARRVSSVEDASVAADWALVP